MLWLLEIIIKFLYAKIGLTHINGKQINLQYSWEICDICKIQLKGNILRYNDNSYCNSCYDDIDIDSD